MGSMSRRVKAKGRMNANNSWWVSDLVAATCECAGLNRDWDGTAQSLQEWLCEMKKKDEGQKEEEHQKLVRRMIASAEGGAGWLHRISKPTVWRGGIQILREEEDNNRPMERREEKKKELAKHWQCKAEEHNLYDTPWGNDELTKREDAMARLAEREFEKVAKCYKTNGSGM